MSEARDLDSVEIPAAMQNPAPVIPAETPRKPAVPPPPANFSDFAEAPEEEPIDDFPAEPEDGEDDRPDEISLYEWLSGFQPFIPGVSYVSLKRTHPQSYRGFNTGGWLENTTEPFDEGYVRSKWGGGTFIAEIFGYRDDKARAKIIVRDRRTVQINAAPSAYAGPNGEVIKMPPEPGTVAAQQAGVMGQAAYPPPGYGGFPQQQYQPAVFGSQERGWNATALLRNQAQDTKVIDTVKQAIERASDKQASALESQIRDMREQLAAARERGDRAAQDGMKPIERIMEQCQGQLEAQRVAHDRYIQDLRAQHETQLREQTRYHEKTLEEMRRQHDSQLLAVRDQANSQINNIQLVFQGRIDDANSRLAQVTAGTAESRVHDKELMSARYESEIKRLDAETTRLREQAERDVKAEKDRAAETEKRLREERDKLEKEVVELRAKKDRPLPEVLNEARGLITSIEKFSGGRFVAGGESGKDEEEPAPDDTIGKLFHYGNKYGEAIAAPIMDRIARLTERNRQQAQPVPAQRGQYPGFQGQQPHYGGGLVEAGSPTERGYAPPQAYPQLPQAAPQPVQAPQTPPQAYPQPVPQAPPQEPQISPEEAAMMDAIRKLIAELEKAYGGNVPAAAFATELKKQIDPTQLAFIQAMPADALIDQLGGFIQEGSALNSAKATDWLEAVIDAVKQ